MVVALIAARPHFALGQSRPPVAADPTGEPQSVRLDRGRFTAVAAAHDERLARSLLSAAIRSDTFPGIPRPSRHVLIAVAPDAATFRRWVGPGAPEWGAAIAIPALQRVVMQGSRAASDAGDPLIVLRHELAHLALHEAMGDLPTRWFDEGYASYAAGEWDREQAFETAWALMWRTMPGIDSLDNGFYADADDATYAYALSYRAVAELAALDPRNGLTNLLVEWKRTASFERGLRAAYAMTGEAFDRHWQGRTRRQYGALALAANLSLTLGFFSLLLGPLFIGRRRRDRKRLEAMRSAEAAAEAAARRSALEALLNPFGDADRSAALVRMDSPSVSSPHVTD